MNDLRRIASLAQMTGLAFRAAQGEMAALQRKEDELRANLATLVADRQAQAERALNAGTPGLMAGADMRWHRWGDQRRATINAELANVLARKEACKAKLQQAFGRDQATKKLVTHAQTDAALWQARRADYES